MGNLRRLASRITKRWAIVAAAAIGIVPTAAVITTGSNSASAASVAVSAARNQFGYPIYYQDITGTRVEPCLEATDPQCVLPTTLIPGAPLVLPTNFPDEHFYYMAGTDVQTTPGCSTAASDLAQAPGKFKATFAVESAFANGDPALGDQMVFGRIRFTVTGGLCPGQIYTVVHPYGEFEFTADEDGGLKPSPGTTDVGCLPVAPDPCNWEQALGSAVLTQGLLRQAGAPAGYLGQGAGVFASVTGGTRQTLDLLDNTSTPVFPQVTTFDVTGRLAGPLVADSALVNFGGVTETEQSPALTINLTNIANNLDLGTDVALTAASFTIEGSGDFDVAVPAGSCTDPTPTTLTRDASCTVNVTFTPSTTGVANATLVVAPNGFKTDLRIPLTGTGVNLGAAPSLELNPTALDFGAGRLRIQTGFQYISVTNVTGTKPLQIQSVTFNYTSALTGAFVLDNQCQGVFVAPGVGNSCQIGVAFNPTQGGAYSANLEVLGNTNDGTPVSASLAATGIGGFAAVSSVMDASNGFPTWYQDEASQRVAQCLDPADPLCVVLPDEFYDPSQPLVFPTNFPEEYFYYVAESDIIATPGCGAASEPGNAFIRFADEAAFGGPTGGPVDGDQIVFGRIRIVVTSGLCPNSSYVFTHPYGQTTVTTDAAGSVRRNAATSDVGCFPTPPEICDWPLALRSPVLGGFIKQVNAPAGYLGDPNTPAPVTGAPFSIDGNPVNYFRIQSAPGTPAYDAQTSLFTVMGKLLGPIDVNPSTLDFGSIEVTAGATAPQTVTLKNTSPDEVTLLITTTGANAADFATTGSTCAVTLAAGAECELAIAFDPSAPGRRLATLSVADAAKPEAKTNVGMRGIGGTPGAAITVAPLAIDYPDLHVGETSAWESVRVSGIGGATPLEVSGVTFDNPAFSLMETDCYDGLGVSQQLSGEAECVLRVAFSPTAAGITTGGMTVHSNSPDAEPVVVLTGIGFVGAPAQSNVLNVSGHQTWYQDDNGVRLEPCIELADPNCIVLADPDYDPAQPQVFPTNFPEEFFYNIADSDIITMDGSGGSVLVRLALEGTFTDPANKTATQTVFARLRVTAQGLFANTTYDFDTPWGTVSGTTDIDGDLTITLDQPNVFANEPSLAGGPLTTGFLRWDSVDGAAPVGYLGVPNQFHTIVGSRYRLAPGGEPVNFVRVGVQPPLGGGASPLDDDGRSDRFSVAGKIAGPLEVNPTALDFGSKAQDSGASTPKSTTITNIFSTDVTINDVTLGGADASNFVVQSNDCGASPLTRDESCTVSVAFAPHTGDAVGPKTATLTVNHDSIRGAKTVTLTGISTPGGAPQMSVTPTTPINYASIQVGNLSLSQTITVRNTGTLGLQLSAVTLGGTNAGDFQITAQTCSTAPGTLVDFNAPNNTCTVNVAFRPTATGTRTGTLTITGDDTTNPTVVVNLSGSGIAAVASGIPASVSLKTKGSTSQTIKITNTGTAPLSLVGAPALVISGPNANRFTASNTGCNNVAPGRSCNVTVTFNAPANGNPFTATLTIKTNAANNTAGQPQGWFTVTLNGTRG